MGKVFREIDSDARAFIEAQKMFLVATAPTANSGLINLSPKGLDSQRVLDGETVVNVDLVGSGIETVAHLKDNGRLT